MSFHYNAQLRYILGAFLVLMSMFPFHHAHGMEFAAEGELVVKEALGESAAGLEPAAMRQVAEEAAEKMGVKLDDIGQLSDDLKQSLKNRLEEAFKGVKIEQAKLPESLNLTQVKTEFITQDLAKADRSFGSLERQTLQKFGAQESTLLENFPPKITGIPSVEGFELARTELEGPAESLADAKSNVKYARSINDEALLKEWQGKLEDAQKTYKQANDDFTKKLEQKSAKVDGQIKNIKNQIEQAKDPQAKTQLQEQLKTLEDQKAAIDKHIDTSERKLVADRYNAAKEERFGSADAQRKIQEANERLLRKGGTAEEKATAQKELKTARENGGAQDRLRNANEDLADAQSEYDKSPSPENSTKLKEAQAKKAIAEKELAAADENLAAARKEWIEKSGTWEAARAKVADAAKTFAKEQFVGFMGRQLETLLSGVVFGLSNYVLEPIQAELNKNALEDTYKKPQRFGNIWMQIPSDLLNALAPASSKFLYVGLQANPTSESVDRSDAADTDEYFKNANFYMSITDYDEYATAAIVDPNFSNQMVHLNTGYRFIGDGLPSDPVNYTVGLLKPLDQRSKSLQQHLDMQAGQVLRGVSGEMVMEERLRTTGYKGNQTIANQLDQTKNPQKLYIVTPPNAFGTVLNSALGAFDTYFNFGPFKVKAFKGLGDTVQNITGNPQDKGAPDQPYVAQGDYIYQTPDTPLIKSLRKQLSSDATKKQYMDNIVDYVVMMDDQKSQIVPLLIPETTGGPYNFASYALNPKAQYMLSLLQDPPMLYNKSGKPAGSLNLDISKVVPSEMQSQLQGMKAFIVEQLKNGPFVVGDVTLTIDKKYSDKNIFVYKVPKGLENGADDYVVAIGQGQKVTQLPSGDVTLYISLVTSRFYDNLFRPYDKPRAGILDVAFSVYKRPDGSKIVVVGKSDSLGQELTNCGGKAPLYSLFMDKDINPNVASNDCRDAFPVQWAISDRGPAVDDQKTRIGAVLGNAAPDLLKIINQTHADWKSFLEKNNINVATLERQAGLSVFSSTAVPSIMIRPTGIDDVRNGNYIYTSAVYPDEYLALSDDVDGTQRFASEFDNQRYAISLSTGNVYDAQQGGTVVKRLDNLDALVNRAQVKPFLAALKNAIKASQAAYSSALQNQEFGPDTQFGQFKLFIDRQDLQAGTYMYGDVTDIANPLSLKRENLVNQIQDYFVAIENPSNSSDNTQWKWGTQLGANTWRILSLVSGALYDRGGTYQGSFPSFVESVDKGIDIGFLTNMFNLLKTAWGKDIPDALKTKITQLNKSTYDTLLKEKQQIVDARNAEAQQFAPLNANLKANIDAQSYIDSMQTPKRYIKKYGSKYYFVSPPEQEPVTYIDYNVGDAGKDNGVGMSYVVDQNSVAQAGIKFAGWVLDNARSYAGIAVDASGVQTLGVSLDAPAIPVDGMVKLDVAALQQKVTMAQANFKTSAAAFAQALSTNKSADKTPVITAANQLGMAKLEYRSAQAVQAAALPSSKNVTYTFYYNEKINAYFVNVKTGGKEWYIDLVGGYSYNVDGSPRLRELALYANKDSTKGDYLFIGKDDKGFFKVLMKGDDRYYGWSVYQGSTQQDGTFVPYTKSTDGKKIQYTVMNDETADQAQIVLDTTTNEYSVWTVDAENNLKLLGTYAVAPTLVYSSAQYFSTGVGSAASYNQDDATPPVLLVWDGKSDLKFQKIMYKNQLLTLQVAGTGYTASYKDQETNAAKPITVTKQAVKYNQAQGHYLQIVDGQQQFNYLYDITILDPEVPVSCPVGDVDYGLTFKLNYWKQCWWGLNVVTDSFGVIRLVPNLPSQLKSVDIGKVQGIPNNASIRNQVTTAIAYVRYDSMNNRYLYQIGSNPAWDKFNDKWTDWYVDLNTGILYNTDHYPMGASLLPSQLYLLLDLLGLSVGPVPDPQGEPVFDNEGAPVLDAQGNPLKVKPGLIYRTSMTVQRAAASQQRTLRRTAKK